MIEILLKTIPKGIFEPIAVFGFAGLLLAVVQYRKKHDILYWLLLFSVLFMVFWR